MPRPPRSTHNTAREPLPPALAETRQRAAAALNEVVYPMVFFDKIACGGCGLGCLVFPVTTLFMKFVQGAPWDTSLAAATLLALVPSGLFVLVIGFQDLIINRTATRFNETFPPGSERRRLAVDVLQDMGEKEEDYRKLLTKLGETVRPSAPTAAPEAQVAAQVSALADNDEADTAQPRDDAARGSSAATADPRPVDAGSRAVAPQEPRKPAQRPAVIPLDPFTPGDGPDENEP